MNVGTAKPSTEDRERVHHHLIDVANPDETWSLSLFQKAAEEAIADILTRHKLPFLVGGTGQFIHAVIFGWQPPSTAPNPQIRVELESLVKANGYQWLHESLRNIDPLSAEKIDPRNVRRTIRALEVFITTGIRFSEQRKQAETPYQIFMIGLTRPRSELYARLDARIEAMFSQGLLEEVKQLLVTGVSPNSPSMTAIGYRECSLVLQAGLTVEDAKSKMRRQTRAFVRRQANWFKENDPQIHWFNASNTTIDEIEANIRNFLNVKANR
jgi:tRNA dimethylallyltransferase